MGCRTFNNIISPLDWPWGSRAKWPPARGIHDFFEDGSIVATLPFNGNANDLGGNYDGTIQNNISYIPAFGRWCLSFPGGENDHVDTSYKTNGGSYSLSALVYPEIFAAFHNYSFTFGHYKHISNDFDAAVTEAIYKLNAWYHVVFVRNNADSHKIYVNGELVKSESCDDVTDTSTNSLRIGNDYYSGAIRNFIGKIDQVRIFNRALSSFEVYKLYRAEY